MAWVEDGSLGGVTLDGSQTNVLSNLSLAHEFPKMDFCFGLGICGAPSMFAGVEFPAFLFGDEAGSNVKVI